MDVRRPTPSRPTPGRARSGSFSEGDSARVAAGMAARHIASLTQGAIGPYEAAGAERAAASVAGAVQGVFLAAMTTDGSLPPLATRVDRITPRQARDLLLATHLPATRVARETVLAEIEDAFEDLYARFNAPALLRELAAVLGLPVPVSGSIAGVLALRGALMKVLAERLDTPERWAGIGALATPAALPTARQHRANTCALHIDAITRLLGAMPQHDYRACKSAFDQTFRLDNARLPMGNAVGRGLVLLAMAELKSSDERLAELIPLCDPTIVPRDVGPEIDLRRRHEKLVVLFDSLPDRRLVFFRQALDSSRSPRIDVYSYRVRQTVLEAALRTVTEAEAALYWEAVNAALPVLPAGIDGMRGRRERHLRGVAAEVLVSVLSPAVRRMVLGGVLGEDEIVANELAVQAGTNPRCVMDRLLSRCSWRQIWDTLANPATLHADWGHQRCQCQFRAPLLAVVADQLDATTRAGLFEHCRVMQPRDEVHAFARVRRVMVMVMAMEALIPHCATPRVHAVMRDARLMPWDVSTGSRPRQV